jgi:hypothetical protein
MSFLTNFLNLLKAVTPTKWINSRFTGYYFESGLDDSGSRSLWSLFGELSLTKIHFSKIVDFLYMRQQIFTSYLSLIDYQGFLDDDTTLT